MLAQQCPTEHDLSAFELGNLVGERYEEISEHLDSCTECARKFETLHVEADGLIEQLRQELPREVVEEDSEVRRLMASAVALENTPPTNAADTQLGQKAGRPTNEQLAQQLLSPPQAEGELGRLGGYRVLEVLGAGGMGVVFKAEDPGLKRLVALKAILPNVADASGSAAQERFLREAQITAAIEHDNIVSIHQVGKDGDVAFIAMQLLAGESLTRRLARQPRLPIADVLKIARETAQGLAAAHAKGLTHRDIKPDNLWLETSGIGDQESGIRSQESGVRVKILDFGLARAADDLRDLTNSGVVVGTPSYLAPEQARGEKTDARADLFSLGVVIYQMLTGTKPFARASLAATLVAIINDTPRPLAEQRDDVPPELSDLVMRLLAKDAGQRPASALEVIRAIRALEGPGVGSQGSGVRDRTPAARKPPARLGTLIARGGIALALLATIIVIIRNQQGKEIARFVAPDGSTIETKPGEPTPLPQPVPASNFLPRMSPLALVERPAKIVATEGEPVLSWTIATVPRLMGGGNLQISLRPDGQQLAVFGDDGLVRLWDVETKQLVQVLVGHAAGPAPAYGPTSGQWGRTNSRRYGTIAWHPKGTLLATASRDGSVRVWDAEHGKVLFEQVGTAGDLNLIAWSLDGSKLAASYYSSQMVRCWSTSDWKAFKPLDGLTRGPLSLDWASDSSTLAVMAQVVMLYKPETGAYRVLESATRPIVRWSPDGSRLASFKDREVVIVKSGPLQEVRRLRREGAKAVETVDFAWSPDSRQLLVSWIVNGTPEQLIHDTETGEVAHSFAVASGHRMIEWLPDGRTVVINGSLIDIESQAVLGKFNMFHEWSEDGKVLLGTDVINDTQPVVDRFAKPGEKAQRVFALSGIASPVSSPTVWSPDGKFVTTNGRVFVSSDATGSLINVRYPAPSSVLSWSTDGTRCCCAVSDGSLEIRSWPAGALIAALKLPFHPGPHAWSSDSSKIAIAPHNGSSVVTVSATTGEVLTNWLVDQDKILGSRILSMDWFDDRIAIATLGRGGTTNEFIYSAHDGSMLQTLAFGRSVGAVRWTPDGKQVLRLGKDALFAHDPADGRVLREFKVSGYASVPQNTWRFVDDETLLLATSDGQVLRLNTRTGTQERVTEFSGTAGAFSPDGQYLANDLGNVRRILRLADGEIVASLVTDKALMSPTGHVWTPNAPQGLAWATAPDMKGQFVYIVQTASGQQTLTPAEFANRYGWQNDPDKVRLGSPDGAPRKN